MIITSEIMGLQSKRGRPGGKNRIEILGYFSF